MSMLHYFKDDDHIDRACVGFDRNDTTSDIGKPKTLTNIQFLKNYQNIVMIDNGATDAQSNSTTKNFIGGGLLNVIQLHLKLADVCMILLA